MYFAYKFSLQQLSWKYCWHNLTDENKQSEQSATAPLMALMQQVNMRRKMATEIMSGDHVKKQWKMMISEENLGDIYFYLRILRNNQLLKNYAWFLFCFHSVKWLAAIPSNQW